MQETIVYTLFSSSKGNSVYIKNKKGEFLIDCGVSAKCLEGSLKKIGTCLGNIKAIFITHEHSDHTKGLETIAKNFALPIYIPKGCSAAVSSSMVHTSPYIIPFDTGEKIEKYDTVFTSFSTPHDSVASCGYTVDFGEFRVGLATDMGYVTKKTAECLCGCKAVIIESNHDIEMLKNGSYPQTLKNRILGNYGHLSNESCASFVPYLAKNGTVSLVLAHLSEENNLPHLAYRASFDMLEGNGIRVCVDGSVGDVCLQVAPKSEICRVI